MFDTFGINKFILVEINEDFSIFAVEQCILDWAIETFGSIITFPLDSDFIHGTYIQLTHEQTTLLYLKWPRQ